MASLEGAILKDKGDGYVSDEEAQDGEVSSVPPPTYDGMPQVSEKLLVSDVRNCASSDLGGLLTRSRFFEH